jgi:hypothetical protein
MGCIFRHKENWRCRKGINALFRGKHKAKEGIVSQALEQEEVRRVGKTKQESSEERIK